MIVAAVVSLLLEVISFFTTLDGAKAYFSATFALAPLFFALAVQSVVYFLENGIRRKVTVAKAAALLLAIACSSYFSFVGIYNNINPPEQYLEQTYNSYAKSLSAQAEQLESAENSSTSAAVNTAVNGILREYTALSAELSSLTTLSEQIAAAGTENSQGMTAPRRIDFYNYEDYAAAYSAYIASLSQSGTEEQRAKTEALLAKYGISDSAELNERIAELTARISLAEGTVGASESGFSARAEQLRAQINAGDKSAAERVFALYRELSGESLEIPRFAEPISLDLPDYSEISGTAPAAEVRERLVSVIAKACDDLCSAGGNAAAEDYPFESVYTLPIYAALRDFSIEAVVALLLAVLVDLLSLLFAMIYEKERSILSATSTKNAADMRNALFEQNVVTALQLGICAEGGSFAGKWDSSAIAERLARFVGSFRAADFAAQKGFSLVAPRKKLGDFETLVAFLCQFGLAGTLSTEDAQLLSNGELSEPCVLLKTKFLLWVSERFCVPERVAEEVSE